jgi:hypothetical protein
VLSAPVKCNQPGNEKNRRRSFVIENSTVIVNVTTKQIEGKIHVESIHICCKYNGDLWICLVDLKCFESIHGVFRIVKLIPDKLATAIAINKEHLSDPKDDGSFLVELVLKLLPFYQEQVQNNCCGQKSEIEVSRQEETMKKNNFLDILNQLSNELKSFNELLKTRENDVIKKQAEKILKLADNLQIFCQVYLEVVHPTLIQVIKILS